MRLLSFKSPGCCVKKGLQRQKMNDRGPAGSSYNIPDEMVRRGLSSLRCILELTGLPDGLKWERKYAEKRQLLDF